MSHSDPRWRSHRSRYLSCSCRSASEGCLEIHTQAIGPAASTLPQHCLQTLPTMTGCNRFPAPWVGGVWSHSTPHQSAAWLHFSLQESTNILCPDTEEDPNPERNSVFSKETTSNLGRVFQSCLMPYTQQDHLYLPSKNSGLVESFQEFHATTAPHVIFQCFPALLGRLATARPGSFTMISSRY